MRLIDADALKLEDINLAKGCSVLDMALAVIKSVRDAPTIDAEVVIHCKDCNQWKRNIGFVDSPNGHCFYHDIDANGYDYCSYGERKDGASNDTSTENMAEIL